MTRSKDSLGKSSVSGDRPAKSQVRSRIHWSPGGALGGSSGHPLENGNSDPAGRGKPERRPTQVLLSSREVGKGRTKVRLVSYWQGDTKSVQDMDGRLESRRRDPAPPRLSTRACSEPPRRRSGGQGSAPRPTAGAANRIRSCRRRDPRRALRARDRRSPRDSSSGRPRTSAHGRAIPRAPMDRRTY